MTYQYVGLTKPAYSNDNPPCIEDLSKDVYNDVYGGLYGSCSNEYYFA